jgi:hypothetical protein|tara:strand:+ start:6167 stop:6328 length:162 start_codon:yes stop_codon:yes gene_type:complete
MARENWLSLDNPSFRRRLLIGLLYKRRARNGFGVLNLAPSWQDTESRDEKWVR